MYINVISYTSIARKLLRSISLHLRQLHEKHTETQQKHSEDVGLTSQDVGRDSNWLTVNLCCFIVFLFIWAVLSDEQMSNGYPFSLVNDEQMSNKVGVEHQPVICGCTHTRRSICF